MEVELLVLQGKQRGQTLRFTCGEFVFGRGPECHVRPDSEWVSRQHCLLRVADQAVHIRDLGSTNGTLVNGSRVIGELTLTAGDKVQVGPLVLQVVLKEASPHGETRDLRALDTAEVNLNEVVVPTRLQPRPGQSPANKPSL